MIGELIIIGMKVLFYLAIGAVLTLIVAWPTKLLVKTGFRAWWLPVLLFMTLLAWRVGATGSENYQRRQCAAGTGGLVRRLAQHWPAQLSQAPVDMAGKLFDDRLVVAANGKVVFRGKNVPPTVQIPADLVSTTADGGRAIVADDRCSCGPRHRHFWLVVGKHVFLLKPATHFAKDGSIRTQAP